MRIVYELYRAPDRVPRTVATEDVPEVVRHRFMNDFSLCPPTVRALYLRTNDPQAICQFMTPYGDYWIGRVEDGFDA